ncbi:MAG TPA: flagellar hook capping FlgD N-terminal domain-containing protein [Bryobacteraceae bacterium]|jgi:flagellar basal-body rod modification protein FlgD
MGAVSNNYPVSNTTGANGANASPDKTNGISGLANENTFLQLLVAQLKNQNPSQPMDGTTFVTQLAQFSELEQSLASRQDLDAIVAKYAPATSSSTTNDQSQQNTGAV